MRYINKKVRPIPIDERIRKNISHSSDLQKRGFDEIEYDKETDTWFSDLNGTITPEDKDLGMIMLKYLDEGLYEEATQILKMHLPYKTIVERISALVEGKSVAEYMAASMFALEDAGVRDDIKQDLTEISYPSRFVIFTGTPQETADMFVKKRIYPLFRKMPSVLGTLLEQKSGTLTGRALRIMDEHERELYKHNARQSLIEKVSKEKFGKSA